MTMLTRPYSPPNARPLDESDPTLMRVALLVHHYRRDVSSVAVECGVSEDVVRRVLNDDALRDRVKAMKLPSGAQRSDENLILRGVV